MTWNKQERLDDLIAHFGTPCFSIHVRNDNHQIYYWFNHKFQLSRNNYILPLKYEKEHWYSKEQFVYYKADGRWHQCCAATQAAWRMKAVDEILLGDDDGE